MTPALGEANGQVSRRFVTAAEESVWLSDRPGDPRIVGLVARFDGALDLRWLQANLAAIFTARPQLRCHPDTDGLFARRHVWTMHGSGNGDGRGPQAGERLVVAAGEDAAVVAMAEQLRLSVADMRPALAVGVVQQAAGDVLVIVVHHAITDGLGALELLRDLVSSGQAPTNHSVDESAVTRTTPSVVTGEGGASREAVSRSPAPFRLRLSLFPSRPVADGQKVSTGFGYRQVSLTTDNLSSRATVNDVLIAATVRAVERWNAQRDRSTRRVSVHMPVDSGGRRRDGDTANATGQAIVFVRAADRADDRLLPAVMRQNHQAKAMRDDHKGAAEWAVAALLWLPAAVRGQALRVVARSVARVLMPSVTVTNLGRVDEVVAANGPDVARPRALYFLTTAGMPQGITVTALGLNAKIHLVVCYAHERFKDASAQDFLMLIVEAMRELTSAGISVAETH